MKTPFLNLLNDKMEFVHYIQQDGVPRNTAF